MPQVSISDPTSFHSRFHLIDVPVLLWQTKLFSSRYLYIEFKHNTKVFQISSTEGRFKSAACLKFVCVCTTYIVAFSPSYIKSHTTYLLNEIYWGFKLTLNLLGCYSMFLTGMKTFAGVGQQLFHVLIEASQT